MELEQVQKRSSAQVPVDGGEKGSTDHHDNEKQDVMEEEALMYGVEDAPPIHVSILLGLQHFSIMFLSQVANAVVIAGPLCVGTDWVGRSQIINTMVFTGGLTTIFQSVLGTRLPIIQGASSAYLSPIFAILSLPQWQCTAANSSFPAPTSLPSATDSMTTIVTNDITKGAPQEITPEWHYRMRQLQGALIVASLLQVLLGVSGVLGLLLRFVTPMVIGVVISLIGIPLMNVAARNSATSWPFSMTTLVLCIFFSQYLRNVQFPLPGFSREKKCHRTSYPIFMVYPILLSVAIVWALCAILTATDVLSREPGTWQYNARTDTRYQVLEKAEWFRVPYPLQWGTPTFSASAALGMCAAAIATTIESIGDYYACAKMAGAPPPPVHACNRGIAMEGLGCVFCGLLGTGLGTTSYSGNIAIILITKVGSRRVAQFAGVWMIVLAVLGKFGAFFVTLPDPIVGGIFFFAIGMVSSAGIGYLQYVNMNLSRNLFILGISLCVGLGVPSWVIANPDAIKTGAQAADQILAVLLRTHMLLGGLTALILDNTIPGQIKHSSILDVMKKRLGQSGKPVVDGVYDFPYVMNCLRRQKFTYFLPFCPTFEGSCRRQKVDNSKV